MDNKKIKNKWSGRLLLGIFILLVMSGIVTAGFGVGSPTAFNLKPGETLDTSIVIMNRGAESTDVTVEVTVEEGSEYISLVGGSTFEVFAGTQLPINVKVSVPVEASIGDIYPTRLSFKTVKGGGDESGGSVEFTTGYSKSININVVNTEGFVGSETPPVIEESSRGNYWIWVILVVVVIILIWWIVKRKKISGSATGRNISIK